jgi:hypothetical protein
MYVRSLHVQHVKLLRDVKVDFVGRDGRPRMWTVFVGENRLCKTTLLQTIAAAALGVDRGTQLVTNVIASWPDLRNAVPLSIEAEFGFSETPHTDPHYPGNRHYPGRRRDVPPILWSKLQLEPKQRVFSGGSGYRGVGADGRDPLAHAREIAASYWFVAGYGPNRSLPSVAGVARQSDPVLDRLRPLFGESLIGTGFIELLEEELGQSFVKVLHSVLVASGLLPHVTAVELRGRRGIRKMTELPEAQRFQMDVRDAHGDPIWLPAVWLSQGYQSVIAWLADLVGQVLLDVGWHLEATEMEGTVLVDEIDLHLHPTWQARLIPALKQVFPRMQFIATTHSPMVLPALAAEEVILLTQDADGSVVATPSPHSPALLTGSELYETFFEIRKLYPEELGEKLHRYSYLATDPSRTAEEDAVMWQLRHELEAAGVELDREPVDRDPP